MLEQLDNPVIKTNEQANHTRHLPPIVNHIII